MKTNFINENKNFIAISIILLHTIVFISAFFQKIPDIFDYILYLANIAALILLIKGYFHDFEMTISSIFLIFSHSLLGRIIAPDNLTSGATLVVNIFFVYSALSIYRYGTKIMWYSMCISYFLLFLIFIIFQKNAEPLFLAAIFALSAVARHPKLLSYFWALILSFTFFQPYSWESLIILFLLLNVVFSARTQQNSKLTKFLLIIGLLFIMTLIFPLISVVIREDPRNIFHTLTEKSFITSIYMSFSSAFISTLTLFIFITPFAYATSRSDFHFKNLIISISDLSLIIPESIAGIALLLIFGSRQPLGELLNSILNLRFDGTFWGICLCQIFSSMPFFFKTSLRAFESIPPELEFTAQTLGANKFQTITKISFPLVLNNLLLASILAFGRASALFGAILLVAPTPETAPIFVFNRFQSVGIHETSPFVAALLIISFFLFFIFQSLASEKIYDNLSS
ncbi:MAG TPA: ABC transporter permease [Victivallales bacterium]|nr:ABC transporter permease [Victivallales bacterium]HRR27858.1 ABC transporter permease [Victivallales bacterium]HRU00343.1 ABC transporter permease [Victivallales bacterium]